MDTHVDTHVAATIDSTGGLLGVESFPADQAGHEELLGWKVGFGPVEQIGEEGTGPWGVGLTSFLGDQEIVVVSTVRNDANRAMAGRCVFRSAFSDSLGTLKARAGRTLRK